MPHLSRTALLATASLAAAGIAAAPAGASTRFSIRGAGFGHGVGMSQYGAMGYAQHGWAYDAILGHYYKGTALGTTSPTAPVRVLLQTTSTATFSGASRAGSKALSPRKTYRARRAGLGQVELLGPHGRIGTFTAPLQVAGSGGVIRLGGSGGGTFRGTLSIAPGSFGVDVINALGLEDYVRGVVALESPASWPAEALKAQAVAARTYAITTHRSGSFDQYRDTRSQMYGGVNAETASTDAAVAATRGQVVTYAGRPVTTYFFSTSGGRTENVEDSVLGGSPQPWLKSVNDPYDSVSPRHRWGPIRMTTTQAGRKLGGLVKGRFRGIDVVERGRSPRVMQADVVGTRGRTRVSGATLRARFGLYDTWAYFTTIGVKVGKPTKPAKPAPDAPAGSPTGGAVTSRHGVAALHGTVLPAHRGAEVQVQRRSGKRWRTVGSDTVDRRGRYRVTVAKRGTYRVLYWGDAGSRIRVR